jgi:V/A-type H+-transporting ATPase subunit I
MIVPMRKIFVAGRNCDRDAILSLLADLGAIHLVPVDPRRAVPDEVMVRRLEMLRQAIQSLSHIRPEGVPPQISPTDAAQEVLDIQRRAAEGRNRLTMLYHQLEQVLATWGNLALEDLRQLQEAGIRAQFYQVPASAVAAIQAECVQVGGETPAGQLLVAVLFRDTPPVLPQEAKPATLPSRDAPSIRAEAKQIEESLRQDNRRLHELANLVPVMQKEVAELEEQLAETVAVRGALADEDLLAFQGWIPAERVPTLEKALAATPFPIGFVVSEPGPDDNPPTLVRPPRWARPIEGLFQMLGTTPGYREFDVSVPFMIALPLFTAILISDGGYGAILFLAPALAYKRIAKALGEQFSQLVMIVGAVSTVWGILTNTFFGVALPFYQPLISVGLAEESRVFMMRLSFTIGAIHLSLAQFWQGVRFWPNLEALAKFGWGLFIWGMYGVVNYFVLRGPFTWATPWPYLLIAGGSLAILFAHPSRNILKTLVYGIAGFPLSMLSAFSDVISYVRLMAVGLASSVLASSFNEMALEIGNLPLMILILLFGHGLNLGLCLIAMFAHGVRLNMLEFSNNLGMQWVGYPYRPFMRRAV